MAGVFSGNNGWRKKKAGTALRNPGGCSEHLHCSGRNYKITGSDAVQVSNVLIGPGANLQLFSGCTAIMRKQSLNCPPAR